MEKMIESTKRILNKTVKEKTWKHFIYTGSIKQRYVQFSFTISLIKNLITKQVFYLVTSGYTSILIATFGTILNSY